MTCPDKLVQAAAEALYDAWITSSAAWGKALSEELAQAALAAAFAALPECEVVAVVALALCRPSHVGPDEHTFCVDCEAKAERVFAALAREFGQP